MDQDSTKLANVISIDQDSLKGHVGEIVRSTVEETLNGLLDAEADRLCNATRYERSPDRTDSRAGSYKRKLGTQAGEVTLKVPKLRQATFETAIIERYKRRETSVEEALVEMYLAGVSVRRVEGRPGCLPREIQHQAPAPRSWHERQNALAGVQGWPQTEAENEEEGGSKRSSLDQSPSWGECQVITVTVHFLVGTTINHFSHRPGFDPKQQSSHYHLFFQAPATAPQLLPINVLHLPPYSLLTLSERYQ